MSPAVTERDVGLRIIQDSPFLCCKRSIERNSHSFYIGTRTWKYSQLLPYTGSFQIPTLIFCQNSELSSLCKPQREIGKAWNMIWKFLSLSFSLFFLCLSPFCGDLIGGYLIQVSIDSHFALCTFTFVSAFNSFPFFSAWSAQQLVLVNYNRWPLVHL